MVRLIDGRGRFRGRYRLLRPADHKVFSGQPNSLCLRVVSFVSTSTILPFHGPCASTPSTLRVRDSMSTSRSTSSPHFDAGSDGLLPAIAQDHATGRVLMMAWMNQEAYEETLRTRQACYYSRSRKALWRKGETSGHRQRVVRVQFDCDADCILIQVEQIGAACHDGYASCFYRTVQDDLSVTIDEPRLVDPAIVYSSKT
jgi:phosphoribosyl-AMP cyclohydrolase